MFSIGSVWFLFLLQMVTAILPDIIIKISENLLSQEFIRKEKFKIEQNKLKHSILTNGIKKRENSIAQLKLTETNSRISLKDTVSDGVDSIESSADYNLYNAIKPKSEVQNKSI